MKFDPPQLRTGELSGRIYVITHGKEIETPNGPGIEASRKYDVTDQFWALAKEKLLGDKAIGAANQAAWEASRDASPAHDGTNVTKAALLAALTSEPPR
jgi:hypothetical protein